MPTQPGITQTMEAINAASCSSSPPSPPPSPPPTPPRPVNAVPASGSVSWPIVQGHRSFRGALGACCFLGWIRVRLGPITGPRHCESAPQRAVSFSRRHYHRTHRCLEKKNYALTPQPSKRRIPAKLHKQNLSLCVDLEVAPALQVLSKSLQTTKVQEVKEAKKLNRMKRMMQNQAQSMYLILKW